MKTKFKKLFVIGSVLFVLILSAMIIIPLVVDVDKYRPQIVALANDHINGKLELGKLKLSLWGRILIDIGGVELKDQNGKSVLSVKNAHFYLPFTSILAGSPMLELQMEKPELWVSKDKAGKLNLLQLVKTAPKKKEEATSGESNAQQESPSKSKEDVAVPVIISQARLGLKLTDCHLLYEDLTSGLRSDIKKLNLELKNISLSKPMEVILWTDIDTKMASLFEVKGVAELKGTFEPKLNEKEFEQVSGHLFVNLDDLEIGVPKTFLKSRGVPANVDLKFVATKEEVKLSAFLLNFHNVILTAKGELSESKPIHFELSSNEVDLSSWDKLLPALDGFDLSGSFKLDAKADGMISTLDYDGLFKLKQFAMMSPALKAKPVIDGVIELKTNEINKIDFAMKAPGSLLKITGNVKNFKAPLFKVDITSNGLDLDQLLVFDASPKNPESEKKSKPSQANNENAKAISKAANEKDLDLAVAPLKQNPMMSAMSGQVNVNLKSITVQKSKIEPFVAKMSLQNLVFKLEELHTEMFSGKIKASGQTDLKPTKPTYQFKSDISGFDLKKAVSSNFNLFKNTVYGKLFLNVDGSGASFNPEPAKKLLKMKGKLKVNDATFTSIDVGKMTTEAINGALDKIGNKIPGLKGKGIKPMPNREAKYQYISSDFFINNGEFQAPNFFAKAEEKNGVDIKGLTKLNLVSEKLEAHWEVLDSHNLTQARDISVNVSGTNINNILAKPNEPVSFPVTVGCELKAPCYSYTEVPEHFTKIALSNIASATKSRAQAEIKNRAAPAVKKAMENAPAPLKKALEGLGGGLFK